MRGKMKARMLAILFAVFLMSMATDQVAAERDSSTEYNFYDDRYIGLSLPMPVAYEHVGMIYQIEGYAKGTFKAPKGLFITQDGRLFVADTENDCVVVTNLKGDLVHVIDEAGGRSLNKPEGVFVTADGEVYIADTGNYRIVKLNADFSFVREYGKPDDASMDRSTTFTPRKIGVSRIGMIYTVAQDSLVTLDPNGKFIGYLGETKAFFTVRSLLVRFLASDIQKTKLGAGVRPTYFCLEMGDDGFIYSTTNDLGGNISKITSVGANVYRRAMYGLYGTAADGSPSPPSLVDISVSDGLLCVIDATNGFIYEYDQEGNNTCIFNSGRDADRKSNLLLPSAIDHAPDGSVYVVDAGTGILHVFQPTEFIRTVHEAISSYSDGRYEEAERLWKKVLGSNANYSLAHRGLGNTYYKRELWQDAMREYKLANYREGYAKAFSKNRIDVAGANFLFVVATAAVILALVVFLVRRAAQRARAIDERMLGLRGGDSTDGDA